MSEPTFVVTGASSGIGRAVAADIAGRGHRVVAVARSQEPLDELASLHGPTIKAVVADVADETGIANVAQAVFDAPTIAGIVHSAASLVPLQPYADIDPSELVDHFSVHVAAPIALYQALAKEHSIERMLFIDSYSAATPRVGYPAYSIIKAAAQMAAQGAAAEVAPTRVIRIFPGAVNTAIVGAVLASNSPTRATFLEMLDRGEFAEPAEAAQFITSVLVDASDDLLETREAWDYNNPEDRAAARPHRR